MVKIEFEWNPAKAKANLKKHGVAFEEAATAFFDDRAIEFYDDSHSDWEDRMLLLGLSTKDSSGNKFRWYPLRFGSDLVVID